MLNWIVWNRSVLTFILEIIVWNKIVYMYKNGLGIE